MCTMLPVGFMQKTDLLPVQVAVNVISDMPSARKLRLTFTDVCYCFICVITGYL